MVKAVCDRRHVQHIAREGKPRVTGVANDSRTVSRATHANYTRRTQPRQHNPHWRHSATPALSRGDYSDEKPEVSG